MVCSVCGTENRAARARGKGAEPAVAGPDAAARLEAAVLLEPSER